jgi:uncharacterized glyoxalase superfamily protein PhnB
MKPNIFPALRYKDDHAAIDWLLRAFGFEKHVVFDGPGGDVAHGELRFGPQRVWPELQQSAAEREPVDARAAGHLRSR